MYGVSAICAVRGTCLCHWWWYADDDVRVEELYEFSTTYGI